MANARLNTNPITDWESFHEICRDEMGFPCFYGMNMNAWIDCMSYLDEDVGMTRFCMAENEMLHIEISDTEGFKSRLPEIFDALVECVAFVNQRYIEAEKSPPISLVFL